jgi:hypothetical protein
MRGCKVAALIAAKKQGSIVPLTARMAAEVKQVAEYNRNCSGARRVGADAVVELLRGMGWTGSTREALDKAMRAQLGYGWMDKPGRAK